MQCALCIVRPSAISPVFVIVLLTAYNNTINVIASKLPTSKIADTIFVFLFFVSNFWNVFFVHQKFSSSTHRPTIRKFKMKFSGAFLITVANRWQITHLTRTSNRFDGVSIMHSSSRSPSARPWVSSMWIKCCRDKQNNLTKRHSNKNNNLTFGRLRKYCTLKHYRTNVYDILCVNWNTGEWLPLRLSWRFLWKGGKAFTQWQLAWWHLSNRIRLSITVFGRLRTIQGIQNGHNEELCTKTSRPHRTNHSLLDSRHCDISIFAVVDIFIFRELVVHGVVVLFIRDIDDHRIRWLCANIRSKSGELNSLPIWMIWWVWRMGNFYYEHNPILLNHLNLNDFLIRQEQNFGFMFHVYEVFIIFWFIFGLGYLVMIMGFIAK